MEFYEIVVKGYVNQRLVCWFEESVVTQLPSGETSLVGSVADQAALYGILSRIRDLGLPLILVRRAEQGPMLMKVLAIMGSPRKGDSYEVTKHVVVHSNPDNLIHIYR